MDREAIWFANSASSECGLLYSHEVPEAMKISEKYCTKGGITKKLGLFEPLIL